MKTQTLLVVLAVMISLTACQKPVDDDPVPGRPPQQQLPNPLPHEALVQRIQTTEIDFQTFAYNNHGQVKTCRVQWQYDEADPTKIRIIDYLFEYDEQTKPALSASSDGWATHYYYNDKLIEKTQVLFPGGALYTDYTYLYNDNYIIGLIVKQAAAPNEPFIIYKHLFDYDNRGNLIKDELFILQQMPDGKEQYALQSTTTYGDFDNKINPVGWMLKYPFLPQIAWHVNNPGFEKYQVTNGAVQTTRYTYEYNNANLPVLRRTNQNGSTKTEVFSY